MPENGGAQKTAMKIYGLLLRLYGRHFREFYGAEAMQLFHDRYRAERGLPARARLWLELLWDVALWAPRQRFAESSPAPALSGQARTAGMPSFAILEGEAPDVRSAIGGAAMSVIAFSVCWALMAHWTWRPLPGAAVSQAGVGIPSGTGGTAAPGPNKDPAEVAGPDGAGTTRAENRQLVEAIAQNLEQYYVDRDAGSRIAQALRTNEKAGAYDQVPNGAPLAELLTKQLRDIGNDRHLEVVYSETPLRKGPPSFPPGVAERYRAAMKAENCTFRKTGILPNNIGYLKLDSFPDPAVCESVARAAMAHLNGADALIFDLRDNRGGYPEMVSLIAAYLFDHPEYLYNPREATTANSWSRSPVPGSRLEEKPVFILTSGRTSSGAEHFTYDLKMLKRATVIGEKTGGAAHSAAFHRINDHFGMGIPEVRAINPFGANDWEGVGIEPDVKVSADDALNVAERLATREARKIAALRRIDGRVR